MKAIWRDLQQEWSANPRVRLGVWLALAIFVLYTAMWLGDMRADIRMDIERLAHRTERLERLAKQGEWPERLERARRQMVDVERSLWRSSTKGLAQANFESWILSAAEESGFERVEVVMEAPKPLGEADGLWSITVQLEARFRPPALYRFLSRVESHPKLTVVSRLEAERAGWRLAAVIHGYFKIDAK